MSPDVCAALIIWAALVGALAGALTGWLACLGCMSSRQRRRGSNPPPIGRKPPPPDKPQPTGGRPIRGDREPPYPDNLPRT
jgi:hypothetical protein